MQPLDETDLKILRVLQQDGSLSVTEVAERVGLSQSPCSRRINRMIEDKVKSQKPGYAHSLAGGGAKRAGSELLAEAEKHQTEGRFDQGAPSFTQVRLSVLCVRGERDRQGRGQGEPVRCGHEGISRDTSQCLPVILFRLRGLASSRRVRGLPGRGHFDRLGHHGSNRSTFLSDLR